MQGMMKLTDENVTSYVNRKVQTYCRKIWKTEHVNGSFRDRNKIFDIKKFCNLKGLMADYKLQKTKEKKQKQLS